MKISILAGGPDLLLPQLSRSGEDEIWVGVDRGAYKLLELGIEPDYAFGDFDSLSPSEREKLPEETSIHSYKPEKDETDLELALDWALSKQPDTIVVYGATGGRLDHEWTNLQLLRKAIGTDTAVELRDRQNILTAKGPGRHEIRKIEAFPYVSFFPMHESIKGMTLEGFKYPLKDAEIKAGSTLTVSNELIEETGTYSFSYGIVLVIRSRDYD